ncbi:LmeA family phospholipid-binding protein [Gordonia soli]|uniref:DUF2993 domain-containing protein n=1 Tax=Gordonia soli NBRC 108243 TaxID=1223545 RepID=M0QNB6_9ACTN|nr:LmeA family phospholipid-binding protein [Gordonia soli]GAC70160.1 hypothetical protein GS4_32_01040 [Gordonia soli NBRC 108243]
MTDRTPEDPSTPGPDASGPQQPDPEHRSPERRSPEPAGPESPSPQPGSPEQGSPESAGPGASEAETRQTSVPGGEVPPAPDHGVPQQTPVPGESDDTTSFGAPGTDESPRAWSQMPRTETARLDEQWSPTGQTPAAGPDDFHPAGPPPTGGVVTSSPARRRRTGRLIAIVAAALVLVVVIAAVGSELYLRNKSKDCLQDAFGELTGTTTSVSISKKPILLQAIDGQIPFVQVDTDDTAGAMRLHARADGITSGDSSTIKSLSGTGFVPFQRVVELSKQAAAGQSSGGTSQGAMVEGAQIESVTGNPADQTITVNTTVQVSILPIPVSVTLKPISENGKVRLEVEKANAFIFGIPPNFAQTVVDQVSTNLFGSLNDEIDINDVTVTDSGIDFAVAGDDIALDKLSSGTSQNSSGSTCSVL